MRALPPLFPILFLAGCSSLGGRIATATIDGAVSATPTVRHLTEDEHRLERRFERLEERLDALEKRQEEKGSSFRFFR